MRVFAAEEKDQSSSETVLDSPSKHRPLTPWPAALFTLSIFGVVLGCVLAIVLDLGPLFLVPVVPSVRILRVASRIAAVC
jgi:hypothetical protein